MTVRTEVDGPVLIVTIDRPDVRNAVDRATAEALLETFERFDDDPARRVAVLTGAGGTFCAGADLHALGDDPENANRIERSSRGPMGPSRLELGKPVIAAVEGHAVAGGLELALWADLRVVAGDAVFGVFCRRWGVPLIDGGTVRLPRLIGQARAMDLILTGRAVGAEEALAIGLATTVASPGSALDDAVALAHRLAVLPQITMLADRASLLRSHDLSIADALLAEHDGGVAAIDAGGMNDGVARFRSGHGRHGDPDV